MSFFQLMKRVYRKFLQILPQNKATPTEQTNKQTFLRKLKKADVVSFDIFDTLITRRLYSPEDIFVFIEKHFGLKGFKVKRVEADNIARQQLKRDINLDDIYNVLKKTFDSKKLQEAKITEQKLELELCIPRKDVLDVFNELISQNKTIILVSDMYLDKTIIRSMLKKCGYKSYKHLYLSNDINARKDTKTIWQYIKKDYPNQTIIHIGDNHLSDATYPKEFNIDTIEIKSGKNLSKESLVNQYLKEITINNIQDSIFWGTIINEFLFNSPFMSEQNIDTLYSLGYIFYGPILDSFFTYLNNHTKSNDQLLFLSREGYYLQKLYTRYTSLNQLVTLKNHYFLVSRKATSFTNFDSIDAIKEFTKTNYYQGTIENWFKQLFSIEIKPKDHSSSTITLPKDYEIVWPYIKKYAPSIIKQSKQAKTNYKTYLKKSIGQLNKRTKLVDLGYSGTIQYELSKMLKKDLCGIYLASSEKTKYYSHNSQLDFLFDANNNKAYKAIYEYSLVLEYFLSAPYGQLIGFTKTGKPVYNDEIIDTAKKETIKEIKRGVEAYLTDAARIKHSIGSSSISKESLLYFYKYCIEQNTIAKSIKDKFDFIDNYTTDKAKNVFKIINRY